MDDRKILLTHLVSDLRLLLYKESLAEINALPEDVQFELPYLIQQYNYIGTFLEKWAELQPLKKTNPNSYQQAILALDEQTLVKRLNEPNDLECVEFIFWCKELKKDGIPVGNIILGNFINTINRDYKWFCQHINELRSQGMIPGEMDAIEVAGHILDDSKLNLHPGSPFLETIGVKSKRDYLATDGVVRFLRFLKRARTGEINQEMKAYLISKHDTNWQRENTAEYKESRLIKRSTQLKKSDPSEFEIADMSSVMGDKIDLNEIIQEAKLSPSELKVVDGWLRQEIPIPGYERELPTKKSKKPKRVYKHGTITEWAKRNSISPKDVYVLEKRALDKLIKTRLLQETMSKNIS